MDLRIAITAGIVTILAIVLISVTKVVDGDNHNLGTITISTEE